MQSAAAEALCRKLMLADTEGEVIAILQEANLWDDTALWRHYGDVENNWGQGGNQQSLAEAALVEKIVNSVDARLVNECLMSGIDPKDTKKAPGSIRKAVARFFDRATGDKLATGGYVEEWDDSKIREVASGITLCATGTKPNLSLTIADVGEGQTPERIPDTILSLARSNKMYIPFVQGQFNQGGTGALRFCGYHNIQFVVSRRNPALLGDDATASDSNWGFTIVRRERPTQDAKGRRRQSTYTYLAPIGARKTPREGKILQFSVDKFPLFPGKNEAYERAAEYGTAIKLFEYKYIGERSNILRGKSLLSRLDLLLPEIALPVRMYEFRRSEKTGKTLKVGSRETTLLGLRRRLVDNPNVEEGFPISVPISPSGEKLIAHIFAFRPGGTVLDGEDDEDDEGGGARPKKLGGARGYRKREGVVFVRNGQTQGSLPKDFFRRDAMKLKTLADDLLVFVDCDDLGDEVREDLFMPSRDRLAEIPFKAEMIDKLEHMLREQENLKTLRNQRQQERMTEHAKDDKPLSEVLQQLIKNSPNLTMLLQMGQRIPAPFNTKPTGSDPEQPYKGEVYPTFFKFKGQEYGKMFKRNWPINQRMRLVFETNARDDYFTRRIERGQLSLVWRDGDGNEHDASFVGPTLKRGIATVTVTLPDDAEIGQAIAFVARVEDSRGSFENNVDATIREEAQPVKGGTGKPRTPSNKLGGDREAPTQLATPKIARIYKEDWEQQKPPFDETTAMRIEAIGYAGDDDSTELYEFKVNMDNTPLLNEIKQKRLDEDGARNQFMYANVLIGLSLLLQEKHRPPSNGKATNGDAPAPASIEDRVEQTCRALAPFLLALTSLGQEDLRDGSEQIDGLEAAG